MSDFHPLKIQVEIITAMVHGNYYPIHLDSLMYWAILNFVGSHDKALQEIDQILSKTNGVYHGSQCLFVKSLHDRIIATEEVRATNFEWKEYKGGFTKVKKSIKQNEGVFRNLYTQKLATKVNTVVFFAHGHQNKILFYLNSLIGIGRWANAGCGQIAKITVSESIEDYSWFVDDKLNRVLPVSLFREARPEPVRACRFKPNYREGDMVDCYIPLNNIITQ